MAIVKDVTIRIKVDDKGVVKLEQDFDNVNKSAKKVEGTMSSLNKSVLKIGASLGAAFAIKAVVTDAIKIIRDFDEQIANLRKTTGLAANDARRLAKEIIKIDTRTSVKALLDLATAAGRLGLAGKDIFEFTKTADKVFVALGDSLEGSAEDIALTLGKVAASFNLDKEFGVAESIERLGSVFNELGAKTKAQESNIIDFTKRLAGVASQANISAPDIAALGALFDANGQSIEVAATTLNVLLPAIGKDIKRFAKIAGLDLEEFSEIVENDAVEALKLVAIGARSSKGGLEGLSETLRAFGVESGRAASIVGILSSNTDQLTKFQEIARNGLIQNTSITEEFNIKNKTLDARIEKLSKTYDTFVISLDDGKGFIGETIKGLVDLSISALKALSGTKSLSDEFLTMRGEVSNLESSLNPLLSRYDELTTKSSLSKDEQIELESIIGDVAKIVPTAVTEFDKYGKALKISTKDAKAFVEEQKNILKVKNAEAIIEQKEAIKELEIESKLLLNTLNGVAGGYKGITRENGELFKTVIKGGKVTRVELEKIEDGVVKFSEKLSNAQAELSGRRGLLAQLTGTETEAAKAVRESTEDLGKNTDETEVNTEAQKARIKAIKASFKELRVQADDSIKADADGDDEDFLKLAGLDDESLEKFKEGLKKKQEAIDEASVQDIESKIEHDELVMEHELMVADMKKDIDAELLDSKIALAGALIGLAGDSMAAQIAGLVFEKGVAIAQVIISGNVAAAAALAPPPIGAGPILGLPLAAGIKTSALLSAATIGATAIPQIRKFKDGVIDLRGAGTATSDSIDAKLSLGESVMTSKETTTHKPMLKAIRDNRFDEWMNRELIKKIYIGKSDRKIRNVNEKSTEINFPDSYNIRNARAISKPIVDAIEEANFLKGAGW